MRILIVGGVAAGASAAAKARRVNEEAEIIVFEKGGYVSFANCGLPYYVGGDVEKLDDLLLVTPELFRERFNIDVRTGHEVVGIDADKKCVTVRHEGRETTESYDRLILAAGAEPVRPGIPGIELEGVHTVACIEDVEGISAALDAGVEHAAVVGGGFIGLEIAEALLKRGVKTTLIEQLPRLLANFDPELSKPLERHLKRLGLKLMLKKGVSEILGDGRVSSLRLSDGSELPAQMVIMAAGMRPRLELARRAGMELGSFGGVVVDEEMRTSVPDIYAAGDMAQSVNFVTGKAGRSPLAGPANRQGRTAGANAAGGSLRCRGAQGTAIVRVGELTAARTGLGEAEAEAAGLDFFVSYAPVRNHAAFYRGAQYIILKLIVENDSGRLLGAQAVGREGTDKRIDVLATAIYAGLTVFDLESLDLAYAPPFSSARDPVIMAGMIAANAVKGEIRLVTAGQLRELAKGGKCTVVDVRREDEFICDSVGGAVNIPLDRLRRRYEELDRGRRIILLCAEGYRAYVASRFLSQKGFDTAILSGGYRVYTMDV